MRTISANDIKETIKQAAIKANIELGEDMIAAFKSAITKEESGIGKEILEKLIENAELAKKERIPICQDTGLVVVFVEMGQEVLIEGGDFYEAIEDGIRSAYREGYLRKSVCHPFTRQNTGDNTPVIIHMDMVKGDQLKLWVVPKGGGSENMSRLFMLPPSKGWEGVRECVIQSILEAGPNPCPPTIVGVGIGGNFEQCAILAKKSLLRPVGSPNPDPELNALEQELLAAVNNTGIGPQGLGGRITSLAVHIKLMPCHIASLPIAVNVQCHANRHVEIIL